MQLHLKNSEFCNRRSEPKEERRITVVPPVIQRLMEVRRAWRLSAEEVANRVGCSARILRDYELGNSCPTLKLLIKWADVLGYDVSLWPKNK